MAPNAVMAPVVGSKVAYAGAFLSLNRAGLIPKTTPNCASVRSLCMMVAPSYVRVTDAVPGMV